MGDFEGGFWLGVFVMSLFGFFQWAWFQDRLDFAAKMHLGLKPVEWWWQKRIEEAKFDASSENKK